MKEKPAPSARRFDSELNFLQSLSESELRELVLLPLLSRMGYTNIRHIHGTMEFGKDIVFSHQDPLARIRHYALVVKAGPLSGSVSKSNSIRAALIQIEQALDTPFLDLSGTETHLDGIYLITPHPLSQQAVSSIRGALHGKRQSVVLIDGPALIDLIHQYSPDVTWSLPPGLPEIQEISTRPEQRPKRAFVIMPFGMPYDAYYSTVFKPGLEASGCEVQRADDLSAPHPIIKDIQASIVGADLILCEMSGHNANVFYELGLAHAIGKPVILVSDNLGSVPFDLRHIRIITYDCKMPDWAAKLRTEIRAAALSLSSDEVWPPPLIPRQR
jgi:hypothetical protein